MELFREKSEYSREMENISRILLYLPGDATAYWKRGQVHEKYGYRDRALEEYRKALALRPGFAGAQQALKALQASQSAAAREVGK